ncbi:MarR family winged helix-turn-helix transcriptional regulator [Microbulbifer variabilis]|uniref:MarR family winged helix-turn-helix transcriptional regulator n=1 Tax=Microbulbifer variabilis TaxID=266805 RepID=UPI0003662E78|nr:MarR family transcriptional regulator [Microbulbifer variabilis]
MAKNRTVHEAAFRLSYDLSLQIAPELGRLSMKLAPQQLRAMRQIWTKEESTLAELSATLKRDKGQVTRLVDELCSLDMVKRVPNPNDGRSKLLKLTKKGYKFFETIEEIEAEFSQQLTKGISKEDLKVFFSVADQLSENLCNAG